jgi:acyl carrier protein
MAQTDLLTIENRLKAMLAATSPLGVDDIDGTLRLVELGMSSLQLQIFAAQVEAAFEFRFDDTEVGALDSFADIVAAVARHVLAP